MHGLILKVTLLLCAEFFLFIRRREQKSWQNQGCLFIVKKLACDEKNKA